MSILTKILTDLYTLFSEYQVFFKVSKESFDCIAIEIDANFSGRYAFYSALSELVNSANSNMTNYDVYSDTFVIDLAPDLYIRIE